MMTSLEKNPLSTEFSSVLSTTLTSLGPEELFGIAFVFTVETGFIPSSLAKHYDSMNFNIELPKMMNSQPLNVFWHENNNIFIAKLVFSNQLCHLTGIAYGNSLNITLSHSNISKCTNLEIDKNIASKMIDLSIKYKNSVCIPIKCAILEITVGQYPSLCGIPEELISYITTKLNSSDLYALMRCCKKLYQLVINNQLLWKTLVTGELNKLNITQRNQIQQPIIDWRNYYYELQRKKSGRRKVTIIREFTN